MPARSVSAHSVATLLRAAPPGHVAEPGRPAYRSLAEGLRRLINDGRVMRGMRLPSERELTRALGLSRTTVARAYSVLRDEGSIVTRRGAGSVASLPGDASRTLARPPHLTADAHVLDLTFAALPAAPGCTEAFERALRALPRHLATSGYHPLGLPETREAIADWYATRGLPTRPDQVVVTCGAHAAFSTILRARLDPGDRVLLESPTYPNAINAVRRSQLRPVGLPMLSTGWDVGALKAAVRQTSPALAYLVPEFHNPTGLRMDEPTRESVARVLTHSRTPVVVDETFVDLALDGSTPPRPFAVFAPDALTIGGVSKSFWGGLRVGWLRAPSATDVAGLVEARHSLDLGTPVIDQLAVVELLRGSTQDLGVRRAMLVQQRDALVSALRERLPQWRFRVPDGGVNLWCELPVPRASAVVRAAERHGVWLSGAGQFGVDGGFESFVRIPYILPPDELGEAVSRLERAWSEALVGPSGPEAPRSLIA